MRTQVTRVPEVGDAVLVRTNDFPDGRMGFISSFGHHCDRCPRWADVNYDGAIVSCPNLEDLEWDEAGDSWVFDGREDAE